MKTELFLFVIFIVCLVLTIAVFVIMNINWFFSPHPQPTPVAELTHDVKDKIFTQVSSGKAPSEELRRLVTSEEADQRTYNWPNIETLLHKDPNDVETKEYVALIQLLQGMTNNNAYGRTNIDFDAVILFVQSGYSVTVSERNPLTSTLFGMKSEYQITPVLATVCALYKEWVTDFRIPTNPSPFLVRDPQGDENLQMERLGEEMLKATILDAVWAYGNDRLKYKGIGLLFDSSIRNTSPDSRSPEIVYEFDDLPYIQLGRRVITFNPPEKDARSFIVAVESQLTNELRTHRTQDNITKYEDAMNLLLLVDAYSLRASMSVMDNTIRMIPCFNETEMQIRVHSYNYTCREGGCSRPANPNHQDVTLAELISHFSTDKGQDTSLQDDYLAWWDDEKDWKVYRTMLLHAYDIYKRANPIFIGIALEQLTPMQINRLHEKVQNPDFVLDLGDVP